MLVAKRLVEKPCDQPAALPLREAMILPAQEITGMHGDQIQERSFPLDITNRFE
jgi:hypothetical protein